MLLLFHVAILFIQLFQVVTIVANDKYRTSSRKTIFSYDINFFRSRLQCFYEDLYESISHELTISTWIITGQKNSVIISMGRVPNSTDSEFRLFTDNSGKLAFEDKYSVNDYGFRLQASESHSKVVISDSQWHHIAFVKNKHLGSFYVDGLHSGSISAARDVHYRNNIFCIAADCKHPRNESMFFKGMFDKFTVYNTALEAVEIKGIFDQPPHEIRPAPDDPVYQKFIDRIRGDLSTKVLHKSVLDEVLDSFKFTSEDLILEFGVWVGNSINKIASRNPHVSIYGFDSFEGLPEDWSGLFVRGSFNMQGQLPKVYPNVQLVKGWFSETLPDFKARVMTKKRQISLLHIDCDLYSSTKTVFEHLAENIGPGTVIVFDELMNFDNFERHEMRAFFELTQSRGISFDVIGIECIDTCQPVAVVVTKVNL